MRSDETFVREIQIEQGEKDLLAAIKYFITKYKVQMFDDLCFPSFNLGRLSRGEQSSSPFTSLSIPSSGCLTASL
jgi:hypothetical protein